MENLKDVLKTIAELTITEGSNGASEWIDSAKMLSGDSSGVIITKQMEKFLKSYSHEKAYVKPEANKLAGSYSNIIGGVPVSKNPIGVS